MRRSVRRDMCGVGVGEKRKHGDHEVVDVQRNVHDVPSVEELIVVRTYLHSPSLSPWLGEPLITQTLTTDIDHVLLFF
jgi:hypothetical protein